MGEALFRRDWEQFKTFLADDILFKDGGLPERHGPDAVVDLYVQTFKTDLVLDGLMPAGELGVREHRHHRVRDPGHPREG